MPNKFKNKGAAGQVVPLITILLYLGVAQFE